MYKRTLIVIVFLTTVTLGIFYALPLNHPFPVAIKDVEKIEFHEPGKLKAREATYEETRQIVEWYNAMHSFKANSTLAGTTPNAGVSITLKSGGSIGITALGQRGRNLEFQAKGIEYPYFATQDDLYKLILSIGGP